MVRKEITPMWNISKIRKKEKKKRNKDQVISLKSTEKSV